MTFTDEREVGEWVIASEIFIIGQPAGLSVMMLELFPGEEIAISTTHFHSRSLILKLSWRLDLDYLFATVQKYMLSVYHL